MKIYCKQIDREIVEVFFSVAQMKKKILLFS